MKVIKNIKIKGKHDKPILTDLIYQENDSPKEVVIFCHGYKGYKDWGAWDLVAEHFAKQNFFFIKMNFSHNGGTVEQPIDFPDLEAFGHNNFIKELDDLDSVLNWVCNHDMIENEINKDCISLIGHSRGGGTVVLKASNDKRVSKVISWAGVSDFARFFPKGEILELWKKNGVAYITNARTKQEMPHYYQFYTSFKENEAELDIRTAVEQLNIPYLIVHGEKDETVLLQEAIALENWKSSNQLEVISAANHTFGSSHPWEEPSLPKHLSQAVETSIEFLKG